MGLGERARRQLVTWPKPPAWGGGARGNLPLELQWYLDGDSITDDYLPNEITADELLLQWLKKVNKAEEIRISWLVGEFGESAPFTGEDEDFLTLFRWPVHAVTGERLNWLSLPVQDKAWKPGQADKGGFIQEALRWKPLAATAHPPFTHPALCCRQVVPDASQSYISVRGSATPARRNVGEYVKSREVFREARSTFPEFQALMVFDAITLHATGPST